MPGGRGGRKNVRHGRGKGGVQLPPSCTPRTGMGTLIMTQEGVEGLTGLSGRPWSTQGQSSMSG